MIKRRYSSDETEGDISPAPMEENVSESEAQAEDPQAEEVKPVDMDEKKTYRVLEDETVLLDDDGNEQVHAKDDEVQLSMNQARDAIDKGARIVGID